MVPTVFEEMSVIALRKFAADEGIVLGKARTKGAIIVAIENDGKSLVPEDAENSNDDGSPNIPDDENYEIEDDPDAYDEVPESDDSPDIAPETEDSPYPVATTGAAPPPKLDMSLILRSGGHLGAIVGEDQMNPGQQLLLKTRREAGYHLTQGFFFLRLDDGAVRISKNRSAANFPPDGTTPFSIDIDPESWATVIEEMSGQSNSLGLHQAARDLHA